tara:strand:- start:24537 stop:25178 length:642 start_codon:yes stop_codon:yes gene_type:complete
MSHNEEWFANEFTRLGALWVHDGNRKRPHALLTKGGHSNGFFNASLILERPRLAHKAVQALTVKLVETGVDRATLSRVVGSALGAITIAHDCSFIFGVKLGWTEKQKDGSMALKRFDLDPGEIVLPVEDVITTGGTTRGTIKEIRERGGSPTNVVGTLVNRSGLEFLDGYKIISLIDREMPIWTPEECPLCKEGSEAVRPKENWSALTQEYPS